MNNAATIGVISVLLAGCGGGGDSDGVTSREVIDHFREQTGELLVRSSSSETGPWEALGFEESTDEGLTAEGQRLAERYGAFTIYVIREGEDFDAEVDNLSEPINDETTIETVEEPDADGIIWTYTCYRGELEDIPCAWRATKRYGENVLVNWQGGEEQETDATFARLNSILTDLQ